MNSLLSLVLAEIELALNFAERFGTNEAKLHVGCRKMACKNEKKIGSSITPKPNTNRNSKWQRLAGVFILACAVLPSGSALGARISDIRGTKHNLSAVADTTSTPSGGSVPTRTVKATTESQVCVFCHTPHGATLGLAPLWNRKLSNATYTTYSSSSLDAAYILGTQLAQPGGSSKLCLSCHDGTLAIGSVNVLNGLGSPGNQQTITMTGTDPGDVMASGGGITSGYTRNLGIDLSNDHPISVNYTKALSDRDGELRSVDEITQQDTATGGTIIGVRSLGYRPKAPLEPTGPSNVGQVQCATCHDPHIRETEEATKGNQKFLILNRFQESPATQTYSSVNDINCVACHDKNQGVKGVWAFSAHANDQVATQTYTSSAASQREFPTDLKVWKAACLNCHDTHTVSGSRRLAREGTDNTGASAIEETCYQCHSNNATITPLANMKDIQYDFALPRHQPITRADQGNIAAEAHDIGSDLPSGGSPYEWVDCSTTGNPVTNTCGADFVEKRSKLGKNNLANRHAECTDCHNPHRVVKFNSFLGNGGVLSGFPDSTGTHKHTDTNDYTHTNLASGALRGTFGVEPNYTSIPFLQDLPDSYDVKRGDPAATGSVSTLVGAPYVTREYQICLKCHSDYGYPDNNASEASGNPTRPSLGGTGLTPQNTQKTNGLRYYTNQALEFQAPTSHKPSGGGEPKKMDSGAAPAYADGITQFNYRSWHPVMDDTGRTGAIRGNVSGGGTDIKGAFLYPWSYAVGTQTMYCDDCHGSNVTSPTSVIPNTGRPWGSHGSENNFILKGTWDWDTGSSAAGKAGTTDLCFKCHDYNSYALGVAAATAAGASRTGFWTTDNGGNDGHQLHVDKISVLNGANKGARCNWCHVAVPHGWKNKALLVNLNDVGPEAGLPTGTEVVISASGVPVTSAYNAAPYYLNARLKVRTFAQSGKWKASDCGSAGAPGNGLSGKDWMAASSVSNTENCVTPP